MRQRNDHRRKIRFAAATRKVRNRLARQTEFACQPTERVAFDFVGRGGGAPGRELRVVHGGDRVGHHRRHGYAGIEQAEVPRMGNVHLPFSQHLLHVFDDIVERQRFAEIVMRSQMRANLFGRHRWNDGAGCDGGFQPESRASHIVKRLT